MNGLAKALAIGVLFGLAATPALAQGTGAEDNPLLATVNEHEIHQSDVLAALPRLPPQMQQLPPQVVLPLILDQLISEKLMLVAGLAQNLQDDEEVAERVEDFRNFAIQDVYLNRFIAENVNDEAVRSRYDETIGSQPGEAEVHARHILLDSEEDAVAAIADIAGGAEFETVAQERSIGPSAPNGGDLGFFRQADMVPEFAEAAFAMDVGAVSDAPVQTQFGWHVIKVEERRVSEPPSFEASRAQVEGELRQEAITAHLGELRESAEITRFNPDGTPQEN